MLSIYAIKKTSEQSDGKSGWGKRGVSLWHWGGFSKMFLQRVAVSLRQSTVGQLDSRGIRGGVLLSVLAPIPCSSESYVLPVPFFLARKNRKYKGRIEKSTRQSGQLSDRVQGRYAGYEWRVCEETKEGPSVGRRGGVFREERMERESETGRSRDRGMKSKGVGRKEGM